MNSRTAAHLSRVRSLIAVDAPAAVALLRRCLAGRNPYTAPVKADICDLAELYVKLTVDAPAETATLGWAVYLRRAAVGRYGETDPRTRGTDRLVIELAQRRGKPAKPIDLRTLTAGRGDGGSRAGRAIAARFRVVDLLHACGLCEAAEWEAVAALCRWAPHHDDAADITYTYLVETLAVLDHCGRVKRGLSVLNAYGAMLPDPGTDGDAYLRSRVRLRLGDRRQIQHHEEVCGFRHRRHSCQDLRTAILHSLARGDSLSAPTATANTLDDACRTA